MGSWQQISEFVSGGFGGMFAWDKAHAIFGTIGALISIAIAVRQFSKRRTAQHELEEKKVRLCIVENELNTKSSQLSAAGKEIEARQKKLEIIERAADSHEDHLWDLWSKEIPDWFCRKWPHFRPRIITLANFKGGVGKTTISANLAIALARHGYRVLIIDLDYQGSLDGRFDAGAVMLSKDAGANALLLPDGRLFDTSTLYTLKGQFAGISLVPAFYELASLENRLMLQWLLQNGNDDLRFRIASKLLTHEVEKQFDVIIMDTPPRLSAGTVNALCVSTDVLIPTVVDTTSTETVLGFAQTVRKFKEAYNYRLELRGVIPSLTHQAALNGTEKAILSNLDSRLAEEGFTLRVLPLNVPRKATGEILSGQNQLYFADDRCRQMFDNLVASLNLVPPAAAIRGRHENCGASVSA